MKAYTARYTPHTMSLRHTTMKAFITLHYILQTTLILSRYTRMRRCQKIQKYYVVWHAACMSRHYDIIQYEPRHVVLHTCYAGAFKRQYIITFLQPSFLHYSTDILSLQPFIILFIYFLNISLHISSYSSLIILFI